MVEMVEPSTRELVKVVFLEILQSGECDEFIGKLINEEITRKKEELKTPADILTALDNQRGG
jgi:hypothetical protein